MREINEIIEHLEYNLTVWELDQDYANVAIKRLSDPKKQLDNANKVKAKLQGAIDLFKEIEEL
jgi:hypothetical protein|tara:strand:- start:261 stop:449 length:189 start_codon:yes stop_codon:yes gene_type:complete